LRLALSVAPSPFRSDIIPELLDGKNIADYVDPEIEARLAELEAEEDALLAADGALRACVAGVVRCGRASVALCASRMI
jgi:nucleolar GTP-binding protein